MKAQDFEQKARALMGGRGWQTKFGAAAGLAPSTIRRWLAKPDADVPDYAAALVELLDLVPAAFRPPRWIKRP